MRETWHQVRLVGALTIFASLAALARSAAQDGTLAMLRTMGYFSVQATLLAMITLLLAALVGDLPGWEWLEYARAATTTYVVMVVAIYWLKIPSLTFDLPNAWTNVILHGASGALMLADWMLAGPRIVLNWRWSWVVPAFPAAWLVTALLRGAESGWVPYGFMDPSGGYARVLAVGALLLTFGWLGGLAVFQLARWRPLTP